MYLYRGFIALGRPVLRDICASLHGKPLLRRVPTSRSRKQSASIRTFPAVVVFQSNNIVLAQVVATLHFDNVRRPGEYVDLNNLLPVTDDLMPHFD